MKHHFFAPTKKDKKSKRLKNFPDLFLFFIFFYNLWATRSRIGSSLDPRNSDKHSIQGMCAVDLARTFPVPFGPGTVELPFTRADVTGATKIDEIAN